MWVVCMTGGEQDKTIQNTISFIISQRRDKAMADNNNRERINRRELIQNTGKGLMAGGLISSGSVTAKSTPEPSNSQQTVERAKDLANRFSDPEVARSAVQEHAEGTLRGIQKDAHIPDGAQIEPTDIDPLDTDSFTSVNGGTIVRGHVEERGVSAEITHTNPVTDGVLTIIVRPQFSESYAVYRKSDKATFIIESSDNDFTTRTSKLYNKNDDSIPEPEPESGCVVGSACRIFADGGRNLITELYCCYDNQGNCYDCYWGGATDPCATECDINSACYNDCYCGDC